MRTMFALGLPGRWEWSGLGQNGGGGTLMKEDRDPIVQAITGALNKVKPVEDLMVWGGNYDPSLGVALGLDATRFFALSNSVAPLFPTVKKVLIQLSDPDPEFWMVPSDEEAAAIRQWTTGVNEMYALYMKNKDRAVTLPPGVPPPPGFTKTSLAPATQVVKAPGAPAPLPTGLTTEELLLGGGMAVGLGLLIYAIAG